MKSIQGTGNPTGTRHIKDHTQTQTRYPLNRRIKSQEIHASSITVPSKVTTRVNREQTSDISDLGYGTTTGSTTRTDPDIQYLPSPINSQGSVTQSPQERDRSSSLSYDTMPITRSPSPMQNGHPPAWIGWGDRPGK